MIGNYKKIFLQNNMYLYNTHSKQKSLTSDSDHVLQENLTLIFCLITWCVFNKIRFQFLGRSLKTHYFV